MFDPILSKYSVVMVDEAHERSLYTDILLGLLKKIQKKRKDLKIIITSARIDSNEMKLFFETNKSKPYDVSKDTAYSYHIKNRLYNIDILYLKKSCRNYLTCTIETILNIHQNESMGDILAFLPCSEDVDNAIILLKDRYDGNDLYFLPLHSNLPRNIQMQIFDPAPDGYRKVIVATSVAETSLTIEGVKYVVDSGFTKMNYFNVQTGIDVLLTCPVAKASAVQRAGRAGRTEPGKCFRLMMEADYEQLPDRCPVEMQRADVTAAVLQLKAIAIQDILHFDFLSPPTTEAMIFSLELLYSLGALDMGCQLTPAGEKMADMPLDPRLAKALLSSWEFGCCEELLSVAAMCSVDYPFIFRKTGPMSAEAKRQLAESIKEFASVEGDHLTLLNIYMGFEYSNYSKQWCDSFSLQHRVLMRAKEIREHLQQLLVRAVPPGYEGQGLPSCKDDSRAVRRCLISGYFANVARLEPDGYRTLRGRVLVVAHPQSVLAARGFSEWVLYHDIVQSKVPMMRDVSRIDPRWLIEQARHYYDVHNIPI